MTVKRQRKDEFSAPVELVLNAVNSVLAKGGSSYRYDKPTFNRDSKSFQAVIKPSLWPLLLSTLITMTVVPGETVTTVIVETRSQWFILGDVFNLYNQYIAEFLSALNYTLRAYDTDKKPVR